MKYDSPEEAAAAAFVAKADRRRALVVLPFEEKIRILRRLQRMAFDVRRAAGRTGPPPWPDDTEAEGHRRHDPHIERRPSATTSRGEPVPLTTTAAPREPGPRGPAAPDATSLPVDGSAGTPDSLRSPPQPAADRCAPATRLAAPRTRGHR